MFVFKGRETFKNTLKLAKHYKKMMIKFAIIGVILFLITFVPIFCLIYKKDGLLILFALPISALIGVVEALMTIKYYAVVFNDNSIELYKKDLGIRLYAKLDYEKLLSIEDFGDYYYCSIDHKYQKSSKEKMIILLQKDLLKQGTLEEFEERFKDKIVVVEQEPKK